MEELKKIYDKISNTKELKYWDFLNFDNIISKEINLYSYPIDCCSTYRNRINDYDDIYDFIVDISHRLYYKIALLEWSLKHNPTHLKTLDALQHEYYIYGYPELINVLELLIRIEKNEKKIEEYKDKLDSIKRPPRDRVHALNIAHFENKNIIRGKYHNIEIGCNIEDCTLQVGMEAGINKGDTPPDFIIKIDDYDIPVVFYRYE